MLYQCCRLLDNLYKSS